MRHLPTALFIPFVALALSACNEELITADNTNIMNPDEIRGKTLSTGKFSNVSGIGYRTETQTGVTNERGEFQYYEGEEITFHLGDIELPTTPAREFITPLDVAGTNNISDQKAINITRFLQNIDDDLNPDNGITISSNALNAGTGSHISFLLESNELFDQAATDFYQNIRPEVDTEDLITETEAIAHLEEILRELDTAGAQVIPGQLQGKWESCVADEDGFYYGTEMTFRGKNFHGVDRNRYSDSTCTTLEELGMGPWVGTFEITRKLATLPTGEVVPEINFHFDAVFSFTDYLVYLVQGDTLYLGIADEENDGKSVAKRTQKIDYNNPMIKTVAE